MSNYLIFLSLIPQRLLGVWCFMYVFQQTELFHLKDVLLTAALSLGFAGIMIFTIPKKYLEELFGYAGINRYTFLVLSGVFYDLLIVLYTVYLM